MSEIASFMLGETPDKLGRYIEQLLAHNHFWLEHDHKYIQVLFPIDEGTKFNSHAPLVTLADRELFAKNDSLRLAHLKALDLMLGFWGMKRQENEIISELPLSPKNHVWLKSNDHNQLRLTRVIRSLTLLGNRDIAARLCKFVVDAAVTSGTVSDKAINYWCNALNEL